MGFLVLSVDSPAETGKDCLLPSAVLLSVEKKNKRASSYGCHLVFVSLCFLLNVFPSLSEFWCPKSVVERIILCHQKKKKKPFFSFFLPSETLHVLLELHWGRWFGILLNH